MEHQLHCRRLPLLVSDLDTVTIEWAAPVVMVMVMVVGIEGYVSILVVHIDHI